MCPPPTWAGMSQYTLESYTLLVPYTVIYYSQISHDSAYIHFFTKNKWLEVIIKSCEIWVGLFGWNLTSMCVLFYIEDSCVDIPIQLMNNGLEAKSLYISQ